MGPMDGGDMVFDQGPTDGGRIHVAWLINEPIRFVYTRNTENLAGFEPQRVLLERTDEVVEARASVTTNGRGRVFVAWHGATIEKADDAHRAVFLMTSQNGGDSFGAPVVISRQSEGACGCCSLEIFAVNDTVLVSYRGAGENVRRGQRLLKSTDGGQTFVDTLIQPWPIAACPVTTTTFARGPDVTRVAWETQGQVYFASHRWTRRRRLTRGRSPLPEEEPGDRNKSAGRDAPGLGRCARLQSRGDPQLAAVRRRAPSALRPGTRNRYNPQR